MWNKKRKKRSLSVSVGRWIKKGRRHHEWQSTEKKKERDSEEGYKERRRGDNAREGMHAHVHNVFSYVGVYGHTAREHAGRRTWNAPLLHTSRSKLMNARMHRSPTVALTSRALKDGRIGRVIDCAQDRREINALTREPSFRPIV